MSLLVVGLFVGRGAIGLVGPDEPRYASIARTMAQTGDWVTPRLWGHPWFEKPILYYWSAATSFKLFGVSEAAARLPNALAALVGALLLALAAWRLWGGRAARLALVIFPTTLGIFAFARAATMDMLLAVSVEAAMVAALFALPRRPRERAWRRHEVWLGPRLRLALMGAFIGLGTLAKGKHTAAAVAAISKHILEFEEIDQTLAHGENKVSFVLKSGLQVDVRLLEKESFGAALHYFTGSKAHNIALRNIAVTRNWKLNEYGLFAGQRRIAGATEEEIYKKLGLRYVEPEMREDRGEIALAKAGKLPKLVTVADIRGDLHTHTDLTGGIVSLEMAKWWRLRWVWAPQ